MRVVIIEDETKSAKELKTMIESFDSDLEVIAMLPSVASATEWFAQNPEPELIFSDIQLGDGLSFEVFRETKTEAPIIFCTAYDEYAIRAFESNSIDYLLKPIEEEALHRSLEKYFRFKGHMIKSDQQVKKLDDVIARLDIAYRQTILVHYRDKILPIKTHDILFIYVLNGVVNIYTHHDQRYAVQYTIEQLESMLNPKQFFRANRKYLVNRDFITNIEHYFNRKLYVATHTETPEKIIVSKIKAQTFLKWMEE